jgi:hypothetical protein
MTPPARPPVSERRLVVQPEVSRRLGELLADKEAVLRVFDGLRTTHRENFAGYRVNRDDTDPDFLFTVPVRLLLRGRMRLIRFSVNDTTSPDHFFVEAVSMSG